MYICNQIVKRLYLLRGKSLLAAHKIINAELRRPSANKTKIAMYLKQFVFGVTMLLSVSASAQLPQPLKEITEKPQEIQLLELAGKLVTYGQNSKSALSLIQAVQIYRQLNVVDDNKDVSVASQSSYEGQLLDEAKKYANGNRALLEVIKDAEKVTRSGAASGPIRYISSVGPDEAKVHHFFAEGGKFISVLLDGQGEGIREKDDDGNMLVSDLRLKVLDKNGHTLATDHSVGENCSVCFISRSSSTLTIEIKNVGKLRDDYVLYIYSN